MSLFDGLHPYEVALALVGVLFFFVLLLLLVRQVWMQRPYGGLLMFFAFPVVMIGWPSIQKVQIGSDSFSLEKNVATLQENPKDATIRKKVEEQVKELAARPISNTAIVTTIARAQLELGDQAASEATLDKALAVAPNAPGLLEVKKQIQLHEQLKDLTAIVEKNPGNATAKSELQAAVHQVVAIPTANPEFVNSAAAAELAIGHTSEAVALNSKALAIDPASAKANQLRQRISISQKTKQ
jgi:hypothetical protein